MLRGFLSVLFLISSSFVAFALDYRAVISMEQIPVPEGFSAGKHETGSAVYASDSADPGYYGAQRIYFARYIFEASPWDVIDFYKNSFGKYEEVQNFPYLGPDFSYMPHEFFSMLKNNEPEVWDSAVFYLPRDNFNMIEGSTPEMLEYDFEYNGENEAKAKAIEEDIKKRLPVCLGKMERDRGENPASATFLWTWKLADGLLVLLADVTGDISFVSECSVKTVLNIRQMRFYDKKTIYMGDDKKSKSIMKKILDEMENSGFIYNVPIYPGSKFLKKESLKRSTDRTWAPVGAGVAVLETSDTIDEIIKFYTDKGFNYKAPKEPNGPCFFSADKNLFNADVMVYPSGKKKGKFKIEISEFFG